MSVRFLQRERALVEAAATRTGLTASEFIRQSSTGRARAILLAITSRTEEPSVGVVTATHALTEPTLAASGEVQ